MTRDQIKEAIATAILSDFRQTGTGIDDTARAVATGYAEIAIAAIERAGLAIAPKIGEYEVGDIVELTYAKSERGEICAAFFLPHDGGSVYYVVRHGGSDEFAYLSVQAASMLKKVEA